MNDFCRWTRSRWPCRAILDVYRRGPVLIWYRLNNMIFILFFFFLVPLLFFITNTIIFYYWWKGRKNYYYDSLSLMPLLFRVSISYYFGDYAYFYSIKNVLTMNHQPMFYFGCTFMLRDFIIIGVVTVNELCGTLSSIICFITFLRLNIIAIVYVSFEICWPSPYYSLFIYNGYSDKSTDVSGYVRDMAGGVGPSQQ